MEAIKRAVKVSEKNVKKERNFKVRKDIGGYQREFNCATWTLHGSYDIHEGTN